MQSPSLVRAGSPSSPVSHSPMPEALQQSPANWSAARGNGVTLADVDMPDAQLPEAATRKGQTAPVPEGPAPLPVPGGAQPLLSSSAGVDVDEEYSRDEHLLNDFIKLHPMLR